MKKLGTFSGVFLPSFEAMLGAVLFLILPGLVAGLGFSRVSIIILLVYSVSVATAFSITDCTTNLEHIGAGGMFAIAKQSLGKAFGGSTGIQLFLAQAVSTGFYTVGFADPLQNLLSAVPAFASFIDANSISVLVQKQIIASCIAFVVITASLIGISFNARIRLVIFFVLSLAIGCILASPFLGPFSAAEPVFSPAFNMEGTGAGPGFWSAFVVFFSAVAGIDAGFGRSGSLRNPKRALSVGTFLSIAVTFVIYILVSFVFGFMREGILVGTDGTTRSVIEVFGDISIVPLILLMGVLFATGSSALSSLMTAPRTAQALVNKDVLPRTFSLLGKDFTRKGSEPRRAAVLAFVILLPVIWAGDIIFVSMVVGVCFLVVYGWINLAAFIQRISGNPGFRPTSKGHWAISLYGFLFCMSVIVLFNPFLGIFVFSSQLAIFMLLLKYKSHNRLEGVWWGLTFSLINWAFKRMRSIIQGTRNWRPIVGIFAFADTRDPSMEALSMALRISDYKGLTMINILKPARVDEAAFDIPVEAEVIRSHDDDFNDAILSIIQGAVPGGLHVNTVFLPLDSRIKLVGLIEEVIGLGRNILLYKPEGRSGENRKPAGQIDVWWKGEENGNFMALLSYIIIQSDAGQSLVRRNIRVIRKLFPGEDEACARTEMEALLEGARLPGEVRILPEDEYTIHETIRKHSSQASLIMVGMPGKKAAGTARLFSLDEIFFNTEIGEFCDFPPILFVKAALVMDLVE